MPELKKFDYFYLRYSPYPMMDDYVTFGVVMLEVVPTGFADVYFSKNYRRLQCFHDDVDLDYFNFLESDIRDHLRSGVRRDELLAKMHDCFGNAVRISPYRECLAEDGAAAIELLARGAIDLPTHPQPSKQEPRGRKRIVRKIQNAFEAVGIWDMVFKNVPVTDYTYPGDPLKIDVSYRLKDAVKMLQAVSLQSNIDSAKALAFSYPQLVVGIHGKERVKGELIAIVEDDLDHNRPEIMYALQTMERADINVTIASELEIIAKQAQIELMA